MDGIALRVLNVTENIFDLNVVPLAGCLEAPCKTRRGVTLLPNLLFPAFIILIKKG